MFGQLVRWPLDVATELVMVPSTLRSLRETLTVLPETIVRLEAQVAETTSVVNGTVPRIEGIAVQIGANICLLYTSPSPRDRTRSRMPSSA